MVNGFFPEEKVSEVRDRSSILEVISDYVSLKKSGKNYKGLCPFHSEKTPSFMVNEEKQIFHCFGCGEGGDVFTFLMKAGHFSFPQAVEELARRYGVRLPSRELSPIQKKEIARREALFQVNQITSDYFHDLLLRKREGEEGRRYLSQREMTRETIEEHRLGYSPECWDGLVQHLREKKVALEMAGELGLILPKKREGWYDAFRRRILFPVFDLHHRVVGFGGRAVGEGHPKYLNSPESIIYHKGHILYGLQVARQWASQKGCVIIVEGYFDLLTLHQHGLKHSVATLGTALTAQHIRTLKRYTTNLITLFDPDPAGIQATLRSLPLFLEEEVSGKAVILPKGDDPDGFLRKGNAEDLEKKIAGATPLIDFFFEQLASTYDVRSIEGKVKVAEEGIGLIKRIPDQIRRDFYIKALAERLGLQEPLLHEMVRSAPKNRLKAEKAHPIQPVEKELPKSEEMLVRLMIHSPELIPALSEEGVFRDFESPALQKIAEEMEKLYRRRGKFNLTEALGCLHEDLGGKLRELALQESVLEGGDREKILNDCVRRIREKSLKRDKTELLHKIQEAEKQEGGKELETLLMKRQELVRRERAFGEKLPKGTRGG